MINDPSLVYTERDRCVCQIHTLFIDFGILEDNSLGMLIDIIIFASLKS